MLLYGGRIHQRAQDPAYVITDSKSWSFNLHLIYI